MHRASHVLYGYATRHNQGEGYPDMELCRRITTCVCAAVQSGSAEPSANNSGTVCWGREQCPRDFCLRHPWTRKGKWSAVFFSRL